MATWLRQTGDKASTKRVRHRREHDRDDRGRLFRCKHRRSRRDNDIDLQPNKFGGDLCVSLIAPFRPAIFDFNSVAVDPAKFTEPLCKRGHPVAPSRRRGSTQESDSWQLTKLLPARHQRPRSGRTAQCENEFSPSDVDCHATLRPEIVCTQWRGRYHALATERTMLWRAAWCQ